jgi:Flp pilus assembly protein TadD
MVTTLEAWVQSHPQDVVALGALAETYQALSRSSEAVASYERLLQLEPNDVTALNNLAWELMTKDPRKGLEYANAARKQSGDHPAVLDTYAMLLLETGDTAQAIDILGQIAEQSPDVPLFRYHLATALAMGGQTDGALELLRALLQEGAAPFAEQAEAKALLAKLEADR